MMLSNENETTAIFKAHLISMSCISCIIWTVVFSATFLRNRKYANRMGWYRGSMEDISKHPNKISQQIERFNLHIWPSIIQQQRFFILVNSTERALVISISAKTFITSLTLYSFIRHHHFKILLFYLKINGN